MGAATVVPPTEPLHRPRPDEDLARRVTLHNVPWSLYGQLLELTGNGLPRMTYDRGTLEMETPSKRHEVLKWIVGRFVEAYAEAEGIEYEAVGSTTWRRESAAGGLEADEAYYIQSYAAVQGREAEPETDPLPDLAIEIDLSPPEVDKASVYARLGVPEIWRWRDGRLAVLVRTADDRYTEHQTSIALPAFPLEQLADAVLAYPRVPAAQSVAAFRRRLGGR